MKRLVIGFLVGMLLPLPVSAGEEKQGNKSVAELELMTEEELATQADLACLDYAIFHRGGIYQRWSAALTTFQTVSMVVRKKKGGKLPQMVVGYDGCLKR
jgi:hypothetical protein